MFFAQLFDGILSVADLEVSVGARDQNFTYRRMGSQLSVMDQERSWVLGVQYRLSGREGQVHAQRH